MSIKIPNAERHESTVMTDTTQDKGSVSDSPGPAGDRNCGIDYQLACDRCQPKPLFAKCVPGPTTIFQVVENEGENFIQHLFAVDRVQFFGSCHADFDDACIDPGRNRPSADVPTIRSPSRQQLPTTHFNALCSWIDRH